MPTAPQPRPSRRSLRPRRALLCAATAAATSLRRPAASPLPCSRHEWRVRRLCRLPRRMQASARWRRILRGRVRAGEAFDFEDCASFPSFQLVSISARFPFFYSRRWARASLCMSRRALPILLRSPNMLTSFVPVLKMSRRRMSSMKDSSPSGSSGSSASSSGDVLFGGMW